MLKMEDHTQLKWGWGCRQMKRRGRGFTPKTCKVRWNLISQRWSMYNVAGFILDHILCCNLDFRGGKFTLVRWLSFFFFLAAFIFVTRIEDIVATQLPVTWLVGAGKAEEKKIHLIKVFEFILGSILCWNQEWWYRSDPGPSYLVGRSWKSRGGKFTLLRCLSLLLAAFYGVTRSEDIVATQVPVTWLVGIGEAEEESSSK